VNDPFYSFTPPQFMDASESLVYTCDLCGVMLPRLNLDLHADWHRALSGEPNTCQGCGLAYDPAHHVYGERSCCPDCTHLSGEPTP
jgi:hypothetical protein